MSQEVTERPVHVPGPLAALGVALAEQDGMRAVVIPKGVGDHFNLITPVQHFAQSDPNFTPSVRLIELDTGTLLSDERKGKSPHFYKIAKDSFGLTKQGLEAVGQAAGIVRTQAKLIPKDELRPGVAYGYRASVWIRRSDGTVESVTRDRDWHEAAERAEIEQEVKTLAARYPNDWSAERASGEVEKRWIAELRYGAAKVESKAINRAIRAALSLPSLSAKDVQKPFLIVGYQFTPDYSDPEVKRILVQSGLGAVSQLYPGADPEVTERPSEVLESFEGPPAGEEPAQLEAAAAPAEGEILDEAEQPPIVEPPLPEPEPEPEAATPDAESPEQRAERAGAVAIGFGRHSGQTLADTYQSEPGYLKWLLSDAFNPGTDEARMRLKAATKAYVAVHPLATDA